MSRSVNRKFRAVGRAELLDEMSQVRVLTVRALTDSSTAVSSAVGQRFLNSGRNWRAR